MKFESRLAERISAKKEAGKQWKTYASLAGIVFIVLTLTSSTTAVPQAVVHLGSQGSVAKHLGQLEGKANVVMFGLSGPEDWICMKVPFKGRVSDLESISFAIFLAGTGGQVEREPYVVLKLAEGRSLVCKAEDSYSADAWSLPYLNWQERDFVSDGEWTAEPADTQMPAEQLDVWKGSMGDIGVPCIYVCVGPWDITSPYQCYIGELAVNGKAIDLANAGRLTGPSKDLPPWF